jgi:hypothetical protein
VIRQKTRTASGEVMTGTDGSALIGLGLGKCRQHPVELSLTVGDVSAVSDVFYNVKALVTPETKDVPAVAVGAEDITDTANSRQAEQSFYLAASKSFWSRARVEAGDALFARSVVTVGYGSGRFGDNAFVAASTSFNAGISVAPLRDYPGVVMVVGGVRLNDSDLRTITAGLGITFWKEDQQQ